MMARYVAERAHEGQVDKAGDPYINHSARVAVALADFDPDVVAVGWLHDVVEDSDMSAADLLAMGFPADTVRAVLAITRFPGENIQDYYARVKANRVSLTVKRADLVDNSSPERLGRIPDEPTRHRLTEKYRSALATFGQYCTFRPLDLSNADPGLPQISWLSQSANQPISLYHSFPQADVDEAFRRVSAAMEVESTITEAVLGCGGRSVGLEYRVKSPISVVTKIGELMIRDLWTRAQAPVYDMLRYTLISDEPAELVELIQSMERHLTAADWSCRSFVSFHTKGAPYKGVHVILDPPVDLTYLSVEVQFHTKQSWHVKQATHDLYEEFKEVSRTSPAQTQDRLSRMRGIFDRRVRAWATIGPVDGLDSLSWAGHPIELRTVERPRSGSELTTPYDR